MSYISRFITHTFVSSKTDSEVLKSTVDYHIPWWTRGQLGRGEVSSVPRSKSHIILFTFITINIFVIFMSPSGAVHSRIFTHYLYSRPYLCWKVSRPTLQYTESARRSKMKAVKRYYINTYSFDLAGCFGRSFHTQPLTGSQSLPAPSLKSLSRVQRQPKTANYKHNSHGPLHAETTTTWCGAWQVYIYIYIDETFRLSEQSIS